MREGLRRLVGLQRLDDELARLEAEAAGLPARRAAAEQARADAAARVASSRAELDAAEHDRRAAEREVADKEVLLDRLQAQSTQVKTNAAYTALLHEMENAREAISEAETKILELLESSDEAQAALAAANEDERAAQAAGEEEVRAIETRERAIGHELARTREERAKLAEAVDAELLTYYERILKIRRPAIAVVTTEICQGCRVGIPPQSYIEALRGEKLVACNSCRRILIHQTLLTSDPPPEPPGDPPKSASAV